MNRRDLTLLALTTVLFLLTACGSGNETAPTDTEPEGVAVAFPPWHVERHAFDLAAVWAGPEVTLTAGEEGVLFVSVPEGRFLLPIRAEAQLDAVCGAGGRAFVTFSVLNSSSGVARIEDGYLSSRLTATHCVALSAPSGIGSRAVYAVGNTGEVYRWNDRRWLPHGTAIGLGRDIWAHDSGTVWVSTRIGVCVATSAAVFTSVVEDGSPYPAVSGLDLDRVMVVGGPPTAPRVFVLEDGERFVPVYDAPAPLTDIVWVAEDYAMVVGEDGLTVEHDGQDWIARTVDPPVDLRAVHAWLDGETRRAVAVGRDGARFEFTDGAWSGGVGSDITCTEPVGISASLLYALHDGGLVCWDGAWREEPPAGDLTLHALAAGVADDVWAAGKQDIDTYVGHFDGQGWTTRWLASMDEARDLWVAPGGQVFVACTNGTVYGTVWVWSPSTAVTSLADLNGVWGTTASSVYVVGDGGAAAHWDGAVWTDLDTGTAEDLRALHGSSDQNVVAVSAKGEVLRYDGSAWSSLGTPFGYWRTTVWTGGADDIWVARGDGEIAHHDGNAWQRRDTGLEELEHAGLWGDGQDVWVLAAHDLLLRYREPPAFPVTGP